MVSWASSTDGCLIRPPAKLPTDAVYTARATTLMCAMDDSQVPGVDGERGEYDYVIQMLQKGWAPFGQVPNVEPPQCSGYGHACLACRSSRLFPVARENRTCCNQRDQRKLSLHANDVCVASCSQ